MKIATVTNTARGRRRLARGAGLGLSQSLGIASQMALLCPSGMDVWYQRQLAGGDRAARRRAR